MKIVTLGSPGVGKGTYTQELVKRLNLVHISTGDIFRKNIAEGTEIGLKIKDLMDAGNFVPDEIVFEILRNRLGEDDCQNGFVLDGFPRSVVQAEELDKITKIDLALNFKADHEVIMDRFSGREICQSCKKIYHVRNIIPKVKGICDDCGGNIIQRDDDKPEIIKNRLAIYEEKSAPLIEFYRNKGILRELIINEEFGKHKEMIMARILEVVNNN